MGSNKGKRSSEKRRLFRGDPVLAVASPWWTIIGLVDGVGWYEIYQAKDESEGHRFLRLVIDSDDSDFDVFEDFGLMPPSIEHTIPSYIKGQQRSWLESMSVSTQAKRNDQVVRGQAAPRRKVKQ